MLLNVHDRHTLDGKRWNESFNNFKSGKFDVNDEERGRSVETFEDNELPLLLDEYGDQKQEKLAEKLGMYWLAV